LPLFSLIFLPWRSHLLLGCDNRISLFVRGAGELAHAAKREPASIRFAGVKRRHGAAAPLRSFSRRWDSRVIGYPRINGNAGTHHSAQGAVNHPVVAVHRRASMPQTRTVPYSPIIGDRRLADSLRNDAWR